MKLFPDHIRKISILSPAGMPDKAAVLSTAELLRNQGFKVEIMPHTFGGSEPHPAYLAASDSERAADLLAAINDRENDLILPTRGGYGCIRLLKYINFSSLARRDFYLAGYSDLTALHLAMIKNNCGIPVTAPMAAKLPKLSAKAIADNFAAYQKKALTIELKSIVDGTACGQPLAANLTVMASLAGTPYFPDLSGRILVLEDVNEPLYRMDRCLAQIRETGALHECSAVVFGDMSGIDSEGLQTLAELIPDGKPVFSGYPFGHDQEILPISSRENWTISHGKTEISLKNLL